MNIAKNHWVTLKCAVIDISLHLLVPVTFSFGTYFTTFWNNSTVLVLLMQQFEDFLHLFQLRWTISKPKYSTDFTPQRADARQIHRLLPTHTSDF